MGSEGCVGSEGRVVRRAECWDWEEFWEQILLPSAKHLEERLTVSQSVSQSGKQPVSQSGKQPVRQSRQTGRQKHTVWLFSVADYGYKQWEVIILREQSAVKW